LRLQKPPLAYWLAAGSFEIFGVSTWAGRLPFALCAWLALAIVYLLARKRFGRRAGIFAAGALLGTYMFARHGRLAETDVLVLLFVTTAIYAFWRAVVGAPHERWWWNIGSIAVGLTILAKGPPALFPMLFLVGLAWRMRRWDLLLQWVKSGGPLTIVLIAAPWFIFIALTVGLRTMADEAHVVAVGGSHQAWFYEYGPWLAAAALPWTGVMAVALVLAAMRWKKDTDIAIVLIWFAATLLPLLLAGQKQKHYLLPALAPLAVLAGWMVDRALRAPRPRRLQKLKDVPLLATLAGCAAAAPLAPPLAMWHRGQMTLLDVAVAIAAFFAAAWVALIWWNRMKQHRGGAAAVLAFTLVAAMGASVMCGVWAPSFDVITPERMAAQIRARFGNRPICFYHKANPPLGFALREVAPVAKNAPELDALLAREPGTLVLVAHVDRLASRAGAPADAVDVPDGLIVRMDFRDNDQTMLICEKR